MNPSYLDCNGIKVSNELIDELKKKTKVVFDNDNLKVAFNDDELFDLTVYNIEGMIVAQKKKNKNVVNISMSGVHKGVYILKITSGLHESTYKFIK